MNILLWLFVFLGLFQAGLGVADVIVARRLRGQGRGFTEDGAAGGQATEAVARRIGVDAGGVSTRRLTGRIVGRLIHGYELSRPPRGFSAPEKPFFVYEHLSDLEVARHEMGHALAGIALGATFDRVELRGCEFGRTEGHVLDPDYKIDAEFTLGCLAGPAAEHLGWSSDLLAPLLVRRVLWRAEQLHLGDESMWDEKFVTAPERAHAAAWSALFVSMNSALIMTAGDALVDREIEWPGCLRSMRFDEVTARFRPTAPTNEDVAQLSTRLENDAPIRAAIARHRHLDKSINLLNGAWGAPLDWQQIEVDDEAA